MIAMIFQQLIRVCFTYIYGIYEETVRTVVQKTIEELNAKSVKIDECIYELYALIFSAEYDSIYGVGNEDRKSVV